MSTKLSFQFSSFPFILKVIGVYRPADFFPPPKKWGISTCPGIRPATGWIASVTCLPWSFNFLTISASGYCPCDTASPYPGTCALGCSG